MSPCSLSLVNMAANNCPYCENMEYIFLANHNEAYYLLLKYDIKMSSGLDEIL